MIGVADHPDMRSSAVEFDEKKARQNALKDWKRDTRGAKKMFVCNIPRLIICVPVVPK